ncbi:MAG: hypothetical protein HY657_06925 [Acidobacteria bacterium]|nr:hypothetical protein [Acidobacteriota bacterium]
MIRQSREVVKARRRPRSGSDDQVVLVGHVAELDAQVARESSWSRLADSLLSTVVVITRTV